MRLTHATFYAVRALAYMAAHPDQHVFTSAFVAGETEIPERFLGKILKYLVVKGVLGSLRGPRGGFALARAPKDISILDVVEALEGPIRGGVAVAGPAGPTQRLNAALEEAARVTRDRLRKAKLTDWAKR